MRRKGKKRVVKRKQRAKKQNESGVEKNQRDVVNAVKHGADGVEHVVVEKILVAKREESVAEKEE